MRCWTSCCGGWRRQECDGESNAAVVAMAGRVSIRRAEFPSFQVVFDDDNRVAPVPQFVQHLQQLLDVVEVQAGGRFVEDVEGLAGVALG